MVAWGTQAAHGEQATSCRQCGRTMNPADAMLGPVCGQCCRANHRRLAGIARDRVRRDRVANKWR